MLKDRNITLYEVAAALDLTVGRVKQIFKSEDLSITRLSIICNELLEMEIVDLVKIMEESQARIRSLTEQQEKQLISEDRLLVVAVSVMNNWTMDEIIERYDISEKQCRGHLRTLEKLDLISIHASGRINLLIDRNFSWVPDGPLEQYFRQNIQRDFLDAGFDGMHESRQFRTGMLSDRSAEELIKKIDRVVAEFVELSRADSTLELQHRTGYSFVLALRPWEMPVFTKLLR